MIGELLSRDLGRKIEEIIQVDQHDESAVHAEITEYSATDSIREQYAQLFTAIAEAPAEQSEGIGVWISGFFGSGKSSFAKHLGYALQNRPVLGTDFAQLFKQQMGDAQISNLLDSITTRIPTEAILFEVAKERDTRKVTERIAELMYTVLLRELDYAEDVENYESLTGATVDVDKNAIASVLKKFATEDMKQLMPLEAQASAHHLPVLGLLKEFRDTLSDIETGSADECVQILAGGGSSLKEAHDRLRKMTQTLDERGIATLRQARLAAGPMWLQLAAHGQTALEEQVATLKALLDTETFFTSMPEITATTQAITAAYQALYAQPHTERLAQFQQAIEKIKGHADWQQMPASMRDPVLQPLVSRCCDTPEVVAGTLVCAACGATISQMESDLAALGGLVAQAMAQIQKATTPPEVKIQRVQLAEFFAGAVETEAQVKQAVTQLQDHLLKLLDEGVKIMVE